MILEAIPAAYGAILGTKGCNSDAQFLVPNRCIYPA